MSQQQPFYPQAGPYQPLMQGAPQMGIPLQNRPMQQPVAQGGPPPWSEYFFPKKPKDDQSKEAIQLRAGCRTLMVGHFLCMILAFAFISSITAVGQILYIALLYSLYQTLNNCMVYLYMLVAGLNLISGVLSVMTLTDGFIWYAMILFYYFLAIKVMWTESSPYRSSVRTNVNHDNHGTNALSENLISGMAQTFKKQLPKNPPAGPQMPPPAGPMMQAPQQPFIQPANAAFNPYQQQQQFQDQQVQQQNNNNYYPGADPEVNFFDQVSNQQQQQQYQVNQTYQDQNQTYFNDMTINSNITQQYQQQPQPLYQQQDQQASPNAYNNAYQNNGFYQQQQQQYPVVQQQQQQAFNPEAFVAKAVTNHIVKEAKKGFKLSNLANIFEDKDFQNRNNQPLPAPRGY